MVNEALRIRAPTRKVPMLVIFDARLAYLAMPKTGSSALEGAMKRHSDIIHSRDPRATHMTAGTFEHMMRPYLDGIGMTGVETCCQIRHPVDWLASWWRYLADPVVRPANMDTAGMDFEHYAGTYLDWPDQPAVAVGRQAAMLCDDAGGLLVRHLFRYEEMDAFVRFLEARLKRTLKVGIRNRSQVRPALLSAPMRARLETHFASEMTMYEAAARS